MSEELKVIGAADIGFDADEPNTQGIVVFLIATVVLLVAVVGAVTYYYKFVHDEAEYSQILSRPSQQLADLRARDNWNLTHYGYLDKAKGQVRLPIDRAMELLVNEAAAGKLPYPVVDQAPKKEPETK